MSEQGMSPTIAQNLFVPNSYFNNPSPHFKSIYTGSQKELITRGADNINQYYSKTSKKIEEKSFNI